MGEEPLSAVTLVDSLVKDAYVARASDIHFDPLPEGLMVRLRVDGVLQDARSLPRAIHAELISRLKILSGLRTDEHQAAQDGRFRTVLADGTTIDVRVSIVPVYHGENAVLRLLVDQAGEFTLETLDFTKENQEKILRAIGKPYGMILATGPTGSGKTTTLYTLVKMLQSPGISIITIEDPVEYAIAGVNQIPVNARTGLSFATGLRSILRQDPNIVMVGEIRDVETAGLAVNTALTGHLLLSTLHTNDAPTTLPRLLDMKVEPYLIASTVNLVISQRLVRRICENCKEEYEITPAEAASLHDSVPQELFNKHHTFYRGTGCEACVGTGYRGRVGIHEVVEIDAPLREAILRKASAREFRAIAVEQGMVPILVDGFAKAAYGVTSLKEILRMRYD